MSDLKYEQIEKCKVEQELGLSGILRQARDLKNDISKYVKDVDETIRVIENNMEYHVFGPRSKNNMSIGKESASSLIDLKQNAENIFLEVATSHYDNFTENLNMDHTNEDIRELRRFHDKIEKLKKNMKFISVSIKKVTQDFKTDKIISNSNNDTTRRGILNSSTASEFSFMAKNRATSSPILKCNIDK